MVLLEFSMYPLDKGGSVSSYVARSLDIIDRSGVAYRCGALNTTMEGELDQLLDVVKQCFQAMTEDCNRVECTMRFDYRKDHPGRLEGHVTRVEEQLGRPVKK